MRLRIAARRSDLARLQARMVGRALAGLGIEVEYDFRESLGDVNLQDPLWRMPAKGVFTEDFLKDLIDGRADLVVHSWKDLPTEPREQTEVAATLPRADVRDVLLFRRDRMGSAAAARRVRVLTSSPRRAHNLGPFLKTYLPFPVERVEFLDVRGNVPTRVGKLFAGDADGLIVAKAALDRLLESDAPERGSAPGQEASECAETRQILRSALENCRWMVLPVSCNPTAAAQGALAVEIRRGRPELKDILARIHCAGTFACVQEERRTLAGYGGGCHQKIGVTVLEREYGRVFSLRGLSEAGEVLDAFEIRGREGAAAPRPEDASRIWPASGDDEPLFSREPLPRSAWEAELAAAECVWVSRATALPADASLGERQVVWCAGLRTWAKLAHRGVWVNGSAEGLGEAEPTRARTLFGRGRDDGRDGDGDRGRSREAGELPWLKLTHDRSAAGMRSLATYRLVARRDAPDLKGKTHFFWTSGTAFDRALELEPGIRKAYHACGPGLTLAHLRRRLGPDARIDVVLGREAWLAWAGGDEPRGDGA